VASIDKLLGRGNLHGCDDINASDFHSFFDKKVADIRASTSNAAVPPFTSTDSEFPGFRPVSEDEVAAAVRTLPKKQYATDPIPTWLLEDCSVEF